MKKTLSMIMALTMLTTTASSITSFAEDNTENKEKCNGYTETDLDVSVDADIKGTIDATLYGMTPEDVEEDIVGVIKRESTPTIYVEVEWTDLSFTYDFGTVTEYEWDIDELDYTPIYKYVNGKGPGWVNDTATITFSNHSNRDVYAGVSFEKNPDIAAYNPVKVSFDKTEDILPTAVLRGIQPVDFTMTVSEAPLDCISSFVDDDGHYPALGALKFYISEETRIAEEEPAEEEPAETPSGEHEHHYVYDQFGRLVCTGCNEVKHEYCIDMDEDGLCDECGLERDFCEDCHVGGKCICI